MAYDASGELDQPTQEGSPRALADLFSILPIAPTALTDHAWSEDIFQHRQFWQQVIELENHTQLMIAKRIPLASGEIVDAFTMKVDLSRIGRIERTEQMQ